MLYWLSVVDIIFVYELLLRVICFDCNVNAVMCVVCCCLLLYSVCFMLHVNMVCYVADLRHCVCFFVLVHAIFFGAFSRRDVWLLIAL